MIYTYENTADSFLHMTMTNSQHHYFGKMPMVEYVYNNEEKQGDFEQMIPLIDAYNILESDELTTRNSLLTHSYSLPVSTLTVSRRRNLGKNAF